MAATLSRAALLGGGAVAAALAVLVLTPSREPSVSMEVAQETTAGTTAEATVETAIDTTRDAEALDLAAADLRDSVDASRQSELLERSLVAPPGGGGGSSFRSAAPSADAPARPRMAPRPAPASPSSAATTGGMLGVLALESGPATAADAGGQAARARIATPDAPRPPALNGDQFPESEANGLKVTAEEPFSTFSVDVDTASYAFMRAQLNAGRLPPPDAVRIEELINYFDYAYPAPETAEEPFRVTTSVTPTPWNTGTQLLHVGIKGYTPTREEAPRANLVLLIDVSGSMQAPNKLPLLVSSFKLLLNSLDADDTVSIVTYANGVRVALEPTPASDRAAIAATLDSLAAGGGTAGAAGLTLAYAQAEKSFDPEAVNRVILATDGDFNIGFSSPDAMTEFVEEKRDSGVYLSVLGFGMGNYNDALMQALAQNGNGVAAYIDTLSEARKTLADEAGGALVPIAEDVKIQVEFNPAAISEYRLIGYETRALAREDFNNDRVDAGDIGSGHTVTALYEITPVGSPAELTDPPRYSAAAEPRPVSGDVAAAELAFVKLRYKLPGANESRLITRPITPEDVAATLDAVPTESRFAMAVAAFGALLRGDDAYLGDYGYDAVAALAAGAKGPDLFGYRSEFVTLVRLAEALDAAR